VKCVAPLALFIVLLSFRLAADDRAVPSARGGHAELAADCAYRLGAIARGVGRAYVYPLMAALEIVRRTLREPRKFYRIPFDVIKDDQKSLWASFAAHVATGTLVALYSQNELIQGNESFADFVDRELEGKLTSPQRGQWILIDALDRDDEVRFAPFADRERYERAGKKVTLLQVKSYPELIYALKLLEQNGPIEVLHLYAHGNPGFMQIGKHGIDSEALAGLSPHEGEFLDDAALVLTSCSVGRDYLFNPVGTKFLRELGNHFLPKGGRVLASNRAILVSRENAVEYRPYVSEEVTQAVDGARARNAPKPVFMQGVRNFVGKLANDAIFAEASFIKKHVIAVDLYNGQASRTVAIPPRER
jgi:hypothetical protein